MVYHRNSHKQKYRCFLELINTTYTILIIIRIISIQLHILYTSLKLTCGAPTRSHHLPKFNNILGMVTFLGGLSCSMSGELYTPRPLPPHLPGPQPADQIQPSALRGSFGSHPPRPAATLLLRGFIGRSSRQAGIVWLFLALDPPPGTSGKDKKSHHTGKKYEKKRIYNFFCSNGGTRESRHPLSNKKPLFFLWHRPYLSSMAGPMGKNPIEPLEKSID